MPKQSSSGTLCNVGQLVGVRLLLGGGKEIKHVIIHWHHLTSIGVLRKLGQVAAYGKSMFKPGSSHNVVLSLNV
jgi:hypothetical protein